MKRADIQKGGFYVGGSMDRIREVTAAHGMRGSEHRNCE